MGGEGSRGGEKVRKSEWYLNGGIGGSIRKRKRLKRKKGKGIS